MSETTPEHTLHCSCVSPSEVHTEAAAEVAAEEVAADASVQIAAIEGETAIALAKIQAKTVEPDLEVALAAALAEVEALKLALAPPAPEVIEQPAAPEPVVVVNDIESDSNNDVEVPPEVDRSSESKAKPRKLGLW